MDWATVSALGLAVGAGAFVQSSIGFGLAVVAAPFIVLLAPDLMPAGLLVTTLVLTLAQVVVGRRDIAWRPLRWALAGRLICTPVGVAVVAHFSPAAIGATVGVLILCAVLASVVTVNVRATAPAALIAGGIAGVSGTAAAIGGPYLALVLQRERPDRLRSTLAAFFLAGSALALGGLAVGGQVTGGQIQAGLAWLPFVVLGYGAALPARARLDRRRLRIAVLWFCVVASLSVIARAVVS